jgi:hypothetical protein
MWCPLYDVKRRENYAIERPEEETMTSSGMSGLISISVFSTGPFDRGWCTRPQKLFVIYMYVAPAKQNQPRWQMKGRGNGFMSIKTC